MRYDNVKMVEHIKKHNPNCPVCEKAMLLDGLICPRCGYDNCSSVEEWKQMHENLEIKQ